jgi:hypothetical protein
MFKVLPPIKHVSIGAHCDILKSPKSWQKNEQLRHDYEAWNNTSVWSQHLIKKQNMKVVGIIFLDTVYDIEEKRIQYILNSSKLTLSHRD